MTARRSSPEADARREQRRALARQVSAMTEEQRAAIVARVGTIATIEGRPLSIHNACMLVTQRPTVSIVGGFQQWKRAGRMVRKGERALALWVPTGAKREPDGAEADDDSKPGFILGNVFDVTQTDPAEGGAQ